MLAVFANNLNSDAYEAESDAPDYNNMLFAKLRT